MVPRGGPRRRRVSSSRSAPVGGLRAGSALEVSWNAGANRAVGRGLVRRRGFRGPVRHSQRSVCGTARFARRVRTRRLCVGARASGHVGLSRLCRCRLAWVTRAGCWREGASVVLEVVSPGSPTRRRVSLWMWPRGLISVVGCVWGARWSVGEATSMGGRRRLRVSSPRSRLPAILRALWTPLVRWCVGVFVVGWRVAIRQVVVRAWSPASRRRRVRSSRSMRERCSRGRFAVRVRWAMWCVGTLDRMGNWWWRRRWGSSRRWIRGGGSRVGLVLAVGWRVGAPRRRVGRCRRGGSRR